MVGSLGIYRMLGRLGDIEVHDPSAVVAEDDQSVENLKRRGCHNEHVDRDNVSQVVLQK